MTRRGLLLTVLALAVAGGALAKVGTSLFRDSGTPPRAQAATVKRPPVVMVVFDEFPTDALLGPDGRIDAVRYPNFAALARGSTWYPNATTVYDSTPKALPAIMDARLPRVGPAATAKGHPNSVFTLFGRRRYRVIASEESSAVCPRRYCRESSGRKPSVLRNLNRGRPERLERWIRSIRPRRRPTFYFKDVLLPHGPWLYLPSGKQSRPSVKDPIPGLASPRGFHDVGVTRFNYQRFLLQAQFLDREMGKLLRRLRQTGLYDRSLIVLTADHGFAWEVGVRDRRKVKPSNVDEIAPVPLIVKAPGQRSGKVDRAYIRSIDIVPTIARLAGTRVRWRAQGRPASSRSVRRRRTVRLPTRDFRRIVRISARAFEARRRENVRRRIALFGYGAQSLYRFGPRRELVGRELADLRVTAPARVRARVAYASLRRRVRARSRVSPVHVAGRITGGRRGAKRNLAVAVNGRIEAVGRSFYMRGSASESFSVFVPESSLREGRNDVRVFSVAGSRTPRLTPIGRG